MSSSFPRRLFPHHRLPCSTSAVHRVLRINGRRPGYADLFEGSVCETSGSSVIPLIMVLQTDPFKILINFPCANRQFRLFRSGHSGRNPSNAILQFLRFEKVYPPISVELFYPPRSAWNCFIHLPEWSYLLVIDLCFCFNAMLFIIVIEFVVKLFSCK